MGFGRARNPRQGMIVYVHFPEFLARAGIQRIHVCRRVARIHRITRRGRARQAIDHQGRADPTVRLHRPVQAAGFGIERINTALERTDKHPAANHGRLGDPKIHGQPKHPFDLQLGNLGGAEPGGLGGLEAGVEGIDAPAVPLRGVVFNRKSPWRVCTEPGDRLVGVGRRRQRLAGQPFG